ncbi:MAG TPA: electron transfer flavoprotein subunit alpha [Candidatus Hydrogenedentes bacterium]|nr:electron transfer flavoprotein subunit alpha [Candidatus Hydrogenedentota bacterium]HOL75453.1 electron transfer flavoprotein subunit alpha [Candidatus Hydrogenedentota bacterium]HPO84962.1 electron transfer flavoprotein subunit alpha [Candidatus Hydrogenedentota bacterium]
METILVVLNVDENGNLSKHALETVSAGVKLSKGLSSPFTVGIVGPKPELAAELIGGCGATHFLGVSAEAFQIPRYVTDSVLIENLANKSQATLILAPGSSRWNRVLPGVAHRLGGRADLHVGELKVAEGKLSITKWYYRQRMEAVLQRAHRPWCLGLDSGADAPWQGERGQVSVEILDIPINPAEIRTQVQGAKSPSTSEQTIRPDAELLFVAGAGWTKKQADGQAHPDRAAELILRFLQLSGASLGGSKSLVDLSSEGQSVLPFMTHLNQVGQTGATPRHPKGLATCCHGEEPHVVGWRFINERRAVNLDPNCGWAHGKADVLYVADAFQVMERLNALLEQEKQSK